MSLALAVAYIRDPYAEFDISVFCGLHMITRHAGSSRSCHITAEGCHVGVPLVGVNHKTNISSPESPAV